MIQAVQTTAENAFASSPIETARRRSTFYVPLVTTVTAESSSQPSTDDSSNNSEANEQKCTATTSSTAPLSKRSLDKIYNPDLSACSFEWSLNESADLMVSNEPESKRAIRRTASTNIAPVPAKNTVDFRSPHHERVAKSSSTSEVCNRNRSKRYGIVLNGSVNLDDDEKLSSLNDENQCHDDQQKSPSNTSTPIKMLKSRSRSNILCLPDKSFQLSPLKEKSKTLPQNLSPKVLTSTASASNIASSNTNATTFPPKYSFFLKSSPKISLNQSFDAIAAASGTSPAAKTVEVIAHQVAERKSTNLAMSPSSGPSPRKALSFIRRAHSIKLSRSNSLLKSLTAKCIDHSADHLLNGIAYPVNELLFERFEECFKSDNFYGLIKEMFLLKDAAVAGSNGALTTSSRAVNCSRDIQDEDEEVHSGKYASHNFIIVNGFCVSNAHYFNIEIRREFKFLFRKPISL